MMADPYAELIKEAHYQNGCLIYIFSNTVGQYNKIFDRKFLFLFDKWLYVEVQNRQKLLSIKQSVFPHNNGAPYKL